MASLVVINIINPWAWRSSTSSQVLNLLQIATSLFLSKWSCKLPSSATRNSNWGLRITCRSLLRLPGRVELFCTIDKHMIQLVFSTRYSINFSENKPQSLTAVQNTFPFRILLLNGKLVFGLILYLKVFCLQSFNQRVGKQPLRLGRVYRYERKPFWSHAVINLFFKASLYLYPTLLYGLFKDKVKFLLSLIIKFEIYIVKQQIKLKLFLQTLSQLTRTYLPFTDYLKSIYIKRKCASYCLNVLMPVGLFSGSGDGF